MIVAPRLKSLHLTSPRSLIHPQSIPAKVYPHYSLLPSPQCIPAKIYPHNSLFHPKSILTTVYPHPSLFQPKSILTTVYSLPVYPHPSSNETTRMKGSWDLNKIYSLSASHLPHVNLTLTSIESTGKGLSNEEVWRRENLDKRTCKCRKGKFNHSHLPSLRPNSIFCLS